MAENNGRRFVAAKNRPKSAIIPALSLFFLTLGLMLFALYGICADNELHADIQNELGIPDSAGISEERLAEINALTASYISGGAEALDVDEYDAQEITHMADVKALVALDKALAKSFSIIGAALFILSVLLRLPIRRGAIWALLALAALGGSAALAFVLDFDGAFILFHRICFRNELWIMNPETSLMIRIYPERFFTRITGVLARRAACAMIPAICAIMVKRR